MDTACEAGDKVGVADTVSGILETHTREPQTLDRGDDAGTAILRGDTIGEVVLPERVSTFVHYRIVCIPSPRESI